MKITIVYEVDEKTITGVSIASRRQWALVGLWAIAVLCAPNWAHPVDISEDLSDLYLPDDAVLDQYESMRESP